MSSQDNNIEKSKKPLNIVSVVALVSSVVSLLVGGVIFPVGLVLSIIALVVCFKRKSSGKILAVLALVISIISAIIAFHYAIEKRDKEVAELLQKQQIGSVEVESEPLL